MIDISSRVLRAMIALDDTRNFSVAAERCHVTQSALSQMVRKLEDDVGLQLVDRNRRNVGFTAEGERFLATARRVMLELDEIDTDLREHAAARRGHIDIAALPSLAAHWLPPIMAQYKQQFPGIALALFDVQPQRALELVRSRQADFALTGDGPGANGLKAELLFQERFVAVCHTTHPLARKRRLVLNDLEGCTYIRLIRTGSISQHLRAALQSFSFVDTGLEVDQVATVAGLVASNIGVSLVPASTIPYFDGNHVVAIPMDVPDLNRSIYLVTPAGKTLSRAAHEFIEMVRRSELPSRASLRSRALVDKKIGAKA